MLSTLDLEKHSIQIHTHTHTHTKLITFTLLLISVDEKYNTQNNPFVFFKTEKNPLIKEISAPKILFRLPSY